MPSDVGICIHRPAPQPSESAAAEIKPKPWGRREQPHRLICGRCCGTRPIRNRLRAADAFFGELGDQLCDGILSHDEFFEFQVLGCFWLQRVLGDRQGSSIGICGSRVDSIALGGSVVGSSGSAVAAVDSKGSTVTVVEAKVSKRSVVDSKPNGLSVEAAKVDSDGAKVVGTVGVEWECGGGGRGCGFV